MQNSSAKMATVDLRESHQQLSYFIKREATIKTLKNKGIQYFFPIQYETFDSISYGCDMVGKDRTGSGKTIAYSLPIIERLRDQQLLNKNRPNPKFLIVLPTRELAIQVQNEISSLRNSENEFKVMAVYGGQPRGYQREEVRRGVDIIAATPGRLLDLLSEGRSINLSELQSVCLDEADEMLKLGFQEDVERIFDYIRQGGPRQTQKLFFSATIPEWVQDLSARYMSRSRIFVDLIKNSENKTSKTIEHLSIYKKTQDFGALNELITKLIGAFAGREGSVIIFCQTKKECDFIYDKLSLKQYKGLLHGGVDQEQRQIIFKGCKAGSIKCIIATNVAARGLDIPSVDLIIQLQPPDKVDDYVHRSGRTGRAGKKGVCVTFYTNQDSYLMTGIEKMAKIRFRQITEPKQEDIIKTNSRELLEKLRNIDEGVVDFFIDAARQFIGEVGAEKALALALAQINGTTKKDPELSAQTKQPGLTTFVFSTEAETTNQKELFDFLKERVERFSTQDIGNLSTLTRQSIVFDTREGLKNKFIEAGSVADQEDSTSMSKTFRLRHIPDEETLRQVAQEQLPVEYTKQEYENAMRRRKQFEVVVRRLNYSTQETAIFQFFRNNNVKVIQVSLKRDEDGNSRGFAFVLCVNMEEKSKALDLNGEALDGRQLEIQVPRESNAGRKW